MPVDKVTSEGGGGKWTPGPWRVTEGPGHAPDCCDLTICGDIFMLAHIRGPNYAHCEANARLITASPKLYAELARLVAALEPLERNGGWPLDSAGVATLNGARAALALAEGTQP